MSLALDLAGIVEDAGKQLLAATEPQAVGELHALEEKALAFATSVHAKVGAQIAKIVADVESLAQPAPTPPVDAPVPEAQSTPTN